MAKILITGAEGLLGSNLCKIYSLNNEVYATSRIKPNIEGCVNYKMDICDISDVKLIEKLRPDLIVHCAALTDMGYCEDNKEEAEKINSEGTRNIAVSSKNAESYMIYISTDAVFNGEKDSYSEEDLPDPINVYGRTKLEGEKNLKEVGGSYSIIRTNIYGWNKKNKKSLAEWMIYNLREGVEFPGFRDINFSSILVNNLGEALMELYKTRYQGVLNIAGSEICTKLEFARRIAKIFELDDALINPADQSSILGHKIRRGKNLSLNVSKAKSILKTKLLNVDEGLTEMKNLEGDYVKELKGLKRTPSKVIPYQKQQIWEEDILAVSKVLKHDFITTGPKVSEFEEKFAKYVGAKYAVAVSSGTAGLHLACLALGLGKGDEIITPAITFLASANCALYVGARPIFSEVNEQILIDLDKIKDKINGKTKAIIPVHYGGNTVDIKKLREIYDGFIIEDSCHALGAEFDGERIGTCKYSDISVFSFHPVKHITTGEGGMAVTNNYELYKRLKILRSHGVDPDKKNENEPWATPMHFLGYNYRITDLQCALGISQLEKIDKIVENSRKIAERYDKAFEGYDNVKIIKETGGQKNSYHLYPLLVRDKKTRLGLYHYLRKHGILAQIHYSPVYLQPYYQKIGYLEGLCPKSEFLYGKMITLPIYPYLSKNDQEFVINKVKEFLS